MIVDSALYREGRRVPLDCPRGDYAALRDGATDAGDFVWVGLATPTQDELDAVAEAFRLHPLAVEDAVKSHQRPKLERYDDSVFLVVKTLSYIEERDAVETGEVNLFVGRDFVITVRHGEGQHVVAARHYLESVAEVLEHGPTAVVYAICDKIVDGYENVVSELQTDVDEIEESVFSEQRTNDSQRIYVLKREIAEVRRAVLPLREPIERAAQGLVPGMDRASAPFFRDVLDHLNRTAETVHDLDDLLSTAFDAHLARISVQQNDDMRKISAGVGLIAMPTLVAGVYGMNFAVMPELDWRLGYPMSLLMMVGLSYLLWVFFKRSGWL